MKDSASILMKVKKVFVQMTKLSVFVIYGSGNVPNSLYLASDNLSKLLLELRNNYAF